jgi:hypothetical protein
MLLGAEKDGVIMVRPQRLFNARNINKCVELRSGVLKTPRRIDKCKKFGGE